MDRWRQLVAVKEERVRGSERLLVQARAAREAAQADVGLRLRLLDEAAEKGRQARDALFETQAGFHVRFEMLRAGIAYSYGAHSAAVSCAQALSEAQRVHQDRQDAVAEAELGVRQACRDREKAQRQRDLISARQGIARARRQDADLEEFSEVRAYRHQAREQVA